MEPSINSEQSASPLRQVTPVSRYFAMLLFIALPFIGGFIGYTFSPIKIVEVEKVVKEDAVEVVAQNQNNNTVIFGESGIKISLPEKYKVQDIRNPYYSSQEAAFFHEYTDPLELPFLHSIEVSTLSSIQNYIETSETEDLKARRSPAIEQFKTEMQAFYAKENTETHQFTLIQDVPFHIDINRSCEGDIYGCRLLKHDTYVGDTKVSYNIVYRNSEKTATDDEIKELLSQFSVEKFKENR